MSVAVILAVCLDPSVLEAQRKVPGFEDYIFVPASTIHQAIDHFRAGDFDLVLLGDSLSVDDQERLTFLIRANGTKTPVICIGNRTGDGQLFADATLRRDSITFLKDVGELLSEKARIQRPPQTAPRQQAK